MKRLLATFFFLGTVPVAPGTATSLAAALLAGVYYHLWASPWPLVAGAAVLTMVGVALGGWAERHFRQKDPQRFTLDEAAGQLVACAAASPWVPAPWPTWAGVGIAFVLFRVLDIFKPPPVRQVERLPGGWGIMADDVVAGAIAAALQVLAGAAALRAFG